MSSRSDRMEYALAREFHGTFTPEERSELGCHGSTAFMPEVAEEEERVNRNDRLRTRRIGKTFKSKERVNTLDYRGRVQQITEVRDEWMLNAPFVPLDEIVDQRTDLQVQVEPADEDKE